uniref:hypothetical protein n=1 Tax=Jatropha curcas TaxID=180498 RepID=UPI0027A46A48|nr:hypothetical protein QLP06_mgp083 [Jatropha curcas]WFG81156.1 hypothetical protein [Jatropha curcas]
MTPLVASRFLLVDECIISQPDWPVQFPVLLPPLGRVPIFRKQNGGIDSVVAIVGNCLFLTLRSYSLAERQEKFLHLNEFQHSYSILRHLPMKLFCVGVYSFECFSGEFGFL